MRQRLSGLARIRFEPRLPARVISTIPAPTTAKSISLAQVVVQFVQPQPQLVDHVGWKFEALGPWRKFLRLTTGRALHSEPEGSE